MEGSSKMQLENVVEAQADGLNMSVEDPREESEDPNPNPSESLRNPF
jgi:hypothetical protein